MLLNHLLKFIEDYLKSQPKRILPGQTMRYGWTMLRFVSDEQNRSGAGPDVLLIEEMQAPFSRQEPSFVSGVAYMLALMELQHEVLRRNRVTGDVIYPHYSQSAIVCRRVAPETVHALRPLKADRAWEPDVRQSGWFIGCCDLGHDHDNPDELALVHLLHLVERFPGLFPYLAMPVGMMLVFEENRAIIFRPNEQEGQVDPGNLFSAMP